MAVKITLSNASQITLREPTLNEDNNIKFSRIFYQYLGSLVKNKTLLDDYDNNKLPLEYRRFLDEMNVLYMKFNYPELTQDLVVKSGIIELDQYLGELGLTEKYPYSKDAIDIPSWLKAEAQEEYRQLVDEADMTYLVDSTDDTRLVYYT